MVCCFNLAYAIVFQADRYHGYIIFSLSNDLPNRVRELKNVFSRIFNICRKQTYLLQSESRKQLNSKLVNFNGNRYLIFEKNVGVSVCLFVCEREQTKNLLNFGTVEVRNLLPSTQQNHL